MCQGPREIVRERKKNKLVTDPLPRIFYNGEESNTLSFSLRFFLLHSLCSAALCAFFLRKGKIFPRRAKATEERYLGARVIASTQECNIPLSTTILPYFFLLLRPVGDVRVPVWCLITRARASRAEFNTNTTGYRKALPFYFTMVCLINRHGRTRIPDEVGGFYLAGAWEMSFLQYHTYWKSRTLNVKISDKNAKVHYHCEC